MAKKILAIFFVSILLCSYIIPTTSAKADVVIGDNDSIVVTQLGLENGKKIATMEAMLQLLESGASEINFNDISDLDDYLEDFYDELTNVNYQDVSNELLAGAYNDVKSLKQWIDDRGEYIATFYKDYLNSADQGLTDIFNHFNLKLEKTSLSRTPLNGVRGMSRFNTSDGNNVPTDLSFLNNTIDWTWDSTDQYTFASGLPFYSTQNNFFPTTYPADNWSVVSWYENGVDNNNFNSITISFVNHIDLYIDDDGTNITLRKVGGNELMWHTSDQQQYRMRFVSQYSGTGYLNVGNPWESISNPYAVRIDYRNSFDSLNVCANYIYRNFRHVNIYYNNEPWVVVNQSSSPTLDIDGFLTMYGNDEPIEYEFPQGTQIDYNALYNTIYNAIRDNLPLDMQTINNNQVYYDSHDTVYSPTIYNYYGKDGDDENDWIDSILDYATIPDFNAVLGTVAVLDAPFVNGITIINTGISDVIPNEILIILGAGFVLVLFVCIINRMSE